MESQNPGKCDHCRNECCGELHAEIIINRSSEIIIEKSRKQCNCEVSEFQKNESSYKTYTKKCKNNEDSTFETIINKEDCYKSEHIYPPNSNDCEGQSSDLVSENSSASGEDKVDVYKVINKELKNRIKGVTEGTVNPVTKNSSEVNVVYVEQEDTLNLDGKSKSQSLDDKKLTDFLKDDENSDIKSEQRLTNIDVIKHKKANIKRNKKEIKEKPKEDTYEIEEQVYTPRRVRDTINRLNRLSESNQENTQYDQTFRRKRVPDFKFKSDIPAWSYLNPENENVRSINIDSEKVFVNNEHLKESETKSESNKTHLKIMNKKTHNDNEEDVISNDDTYKKDDQNLVNNDREACMVKSVIDDTSNKSEENLINTSDLKTETPNVNERSQKKKRNNNDQKKGKNKRKEYSNTDEECNVGRNETQNLSGIDSDQYDGVGNVRSQVKPKENYSEDQESDIPPKNMVKSIVQFMEMKHRELSEERNRSRDASLEPKERTRRNTRDSSKDKFEGDTVTSSEKEKTNQDNEKRLSRSIDTKITIETINKEPVHVIYDSDAQIIDVPDEVAKISTVSSLMKRFQDDDLEDYEKDEMITHISGHEIRSNDGGKVEIKTEGDNASAVLDDTNYKQSEEEMTNNPNITFKTISQTIDTVIHPGITKEIEKIENKEETLENEIDSVHMNEKVVESNEEISDKATSKDDSKSNEYVDYIIEVIKDPLNLNTNTNNVFDVAFRNSTSQVIHNEKLIKSLNELGDFKIMVENDPDETFANVTNSPTPSPVRDSESLGETNKVENDYKEHGVPTKSLKEDSESKKDDTSRLDDQSLEGNIKQKSNLERIKISTDDNVVDYAEKENFNSKPSTESPTIDTDTHEKSKTAQEDISTEQVMSEKTLLSTSMKRTDTNSKSERSETIQEYSMKSSEKHIEIKKVDKYFEMKEFSTRIVKNEEQDSLIQGIESEEDDYTNKLDNDDSLNKITIERKVDSPTKSNKITQKYLDQNLPNKSSTVDASPENSTEKILEEKNNTGSSIPTSEKEQILEEISRTQTVTVNPITENADTKFDIVKCANEVSDQFNYLRNKENAINHEESLLLHKDDNSHPNIINSKEENTEVVEYTRKQSGNFDEESKIDSSKSSIETSRQKRNIEDRSAEQDVLCESNIKGGEITPNENKDEIIDNTEAKVNEITENAGGNIQSLVSTETVISEDKFNVVLDNNTKVTHQEQKNETEVKQDLDDTEGEHEKDTMNNEAEIVKPSNEEPIEIKISEKDIVDESEVFKNTNIISNTIVESTSVSDFERKHNIENTESENYVQETDPEGEVKDLVETEIQTVDILLNETENSEAREKILNIHEISSEEFERIDDTSKDSKSIPINMESDHEKEAENIGDLVNESIDISSVDNEKNGNSEDLDFNVKKNIETILFEHIEITEEEKMSNDRSDEEIPRPEEKQTNVLNPTTNVNAEDLNLPSGISDDQETIVPENNQIKQEEDIFEQANEAIKEREHSVLEKKEESQNEEVSYLLGKEKSGTQNIEQNPTSDERYSPEINTQIEEKRPELESTETNENECVKIHEEKSSISMVNEEVGNGTDVRGKKLVDVQNNIIDNEENEDSKHRYPRSLEEDNVDANLIQKEHDNNHDESQSVNDADESVVDSENLKELSENKISNESSMYDSTSGKEESTDISKPSNRVEDHDNSYDYVNRTTTSAKNMPNEGENKKDSHKVTKITTDEVKENVLMDEADQKENCAEKEQDSDTKKLQENFVLLPSKCEEIASDLPSTEENKVNKENHTKSLKNFGSKSTLVDETFNEDNMSNKKNESFDIHTVSGKKLETELLKDEVSVERHDDDSEENEKNYGNTSNNKFESITNFIQKERLYDVQHINSQSDVTEVEFKDVSNKVKIIESVTHLLQDESKNNIIKVSENSTEILEKNIDNNASSINSDDTIVIENINNVRKSSELQGDTSNLSNETNIEGNVHESHEIIDTQTTNNKTQSDDKTSKEIKIPISRSNSENLIYVSNDDNRRPQNEHIDKKIIPNISNDEVDYKTEGGDSIVIEKTYDAQKDEMKLDISHTMDETDNKNVHVITHDDDYPNISVQIKISYNTAEEKGSLDQKFTLNNKENIQDQKNTESLDYDNKVESKQQLDQTFIPKKDITCLKKSTYTCIEENFENDGVVGKNILKKKTNIMNDQNLLRNKDSKGTESKSKITSFDIFDKPKSDHQMGKLTMKKHTMREIKSFEYQEVYEENLSKFQKMRGGKKKFNKRTMSNSRSSSEDSKHTDSDTSPIEHEFTISEPPSKENKDGPEWRLQGLPITSYTSTSKSRNTLPRSCYYNVADVSHLMDDKMNNEVYKMNLNTYQDINNKNKNKPIHKIKNKTRTCCLNKFHSEKAEKTCAACSSLEESRPRFITTVKKGMFLEPPPDVAAMLGLALKENASDARQNVVYSFSSKPRLCQHERDKLRTESCQGNESTRKELRRPRGSTSHQHSNQHNPHSSQHNPHSSQHNPHSSQHNPDIIGMEAQGFRFTEAKRRTMTRNRVQASQYRHLRTRIDSPPAVMGRRHEIVQTAQTGDILEELTDNPSTRSLSIQTDPSFESIPSTSTARRSGVSTDCEVQTDDVFDYTYDVQPVLDVILSSAYREALMEVLTEEEVMEVERKERIYKEARGQNEARDETS